MESKTKIIFKDYTLNDTDIELLKKSCNVCIKYKRCNCTKIGKCLQHQTILKMAYKKFKNEELKK